MTLLREYIRSVLSEQNDDLTASFGAFMGEYQSLVKPNPLNPRLDYWYMGKKDDAECLVMTSVDEWDGAIHIASIQTVPPEVCEGQGYASQVMNTLVNLADKHGVPMSIDPVPFGSEKMGVKELSSWYHRAGFKPDPKYGGELRRQPR